MAFNIKSLESFLIIIHKILTDLGLNEKVLIMKRLLLIIILNFSFQSFTLADDIRDFQIEGISIGESLLKFTTEKKIKSSLASNQYSNDKYIIYMADKFINLDNYDFLAATVKKNDNQYIITSLKGAIFYNNLEECIKLRSEIRIFIEEIINFDDIEEKIYDSQDGFGVVHALQMYLKPSPSNESIVLNCNDYFKNSGFKNDLSISVNPEDYAYFLINEAYK